MELVIDGRTMAVRWPSGVPVTDVSLVLGDTVPVRIRVDHALTDCTPALAVKQTIGSADLVMTVTAFTRQDDWQEASWVVNTVPLQEALDSADRVELVGEVVLVAPDGAQHTSRPIRVTVRRDILPADYAPPVEVLADWSDLVATALAAQLPAALKDAGVELEAATGQSTLSSGDAADTWTIVGGYAMTWGDEILAGHLPDSCRLTSISTVYFFTDPALNQYCLRIWRLTDGAYSLIGTSAYVSNLSSGQTATWVFTPGVPLTRGDVIIIQVCEGTEMTPYALGMHAVLTPSVPGRGLVAEVANPPAVNGTMAPLMTVVVDYDDGITLGGMELATARQLDSLGRDVRQSSATSEAAARTAGQSAAAASRAANNAATSATSAANSATAVQQALAAIPQVDDAGNMTIPGGLTAAGTVNANGGINIPLAAGAQTDTAAVSRAYALGMAHAAMMHQTRTYWVTSSCTATNGVAINHIAPGCYCEAILAANIRTSVTLPSAGALGGGNYSKIAGYSLPVKFSGGSEGSAFKISMIIGGSGQFEEYPDAGIDDFRLRPVVGSAADITRLVDVTLYYDNGYKARVRELIGIGSPKRYVVRTTLSNLDYNSNTNPCSATYRVVIAQSEIGHGDALAAGVWMVMGGLSNDTIIKLADIRCWDTYHVLYAPVIYLDAQAGLYGGVISAESPTIINGVGGNTYVRFGLEPYQRSWITSATEEPYTEQPTEL